MSARRKNSQRARVVRAADLSVEGSGIMPSGPLFVYAKALGEAAAKKGEAVPVTKDILRIKKLYKDEEFLSKVEVVVNEPLKTQVEKATACVELMQPFESTVMPKFVVYLAKKRRFKTLAPLCDWYIKSLYAEQSIAPVTVISAQRLTEEQIQTVSEKMKEKTGASDVKLILKVDSSLLGGLIIEWGYPDPEKPVQGSMTIDMSLKTYLEQAALSEGVLTSV